MRLGIGPAEPAIDGVTGAEDRSCLIHVVTRLMRHADSNVTLEHYAHILGDAERVASEKFSQRIGQQITQLESDSEMELDSVCKTA